LGPCSKSPLGALGVLDEVAEALALWRADDADEDDELLALLLVLLLDAADDDTDDEGVSEAARLTRVCEAAALDGGTRCVGAATEVTRTAEETTATVGVSKRLSSASSSGIGTGRAALGVWRLLSTSAA